MSSLEKAGERKWPTIKEVQEADPDQIYKWVDELEAETEEQAEIQREFTTAFVELIR